MRNLTILNGEEMRKFRKTENLTQSELAEIMGLTVKYIYLHEAGVKSIKKISSWQNLNDYIMGGNNEISH